MLDRGEQLLAVLILEATLGYPQALHRRVPHPVVWVGRLITMLERRWNRQGARPRREVRACVAGVAVLILLVTLGTGLGLALEHLLTSWAGSALLILIATTGLAQKSLHDHVRAVAHPLAAGNLAQARTALAMIVGRDVHALDEEGIAAAATESLAESFCDGVVAPAFWFLIAGLPGLFAFKAISTADSIIGHKDQRYRHFGWASARADDFMNVVPARISGLLLCFTAPASRGWSIMLRDARKHLSPNAGWPEAAMAGVLDVCLGGGASYEGEWIDRVELGDGPRPDRHDLRRALANYRRALLLLWLITGGLAWAL